MKQSKADLAAEVEKLERTVIEQAAEIAKAENKLQAAQERAATADRHGKVVYAMLRVMIAREDLGDELTPLGRQLTAVLNEMRWVLSR